MRISHHSSAPKGGGEGVFKTGLSVTEGVETILGVWNCWLGARLFLVIFFFFFCGGERKDSGRDIFYGFIQRQCTFWSFGLCWVHFLPTQTFRAFNNFASFTLFLLSLPSLSTPVGFQLNSSLKWNAHALCKTIKLLRSEEAKKKV